MKHNNTADSQIARLLNIMATLRDPLLGCPWDRAQSFQSIVPYTLEEAYELADAIDKGDMEEVCDELGDVLFQVVFYAQLGKEQRQFDFALVAKGIADKLERRHPHVFGNQMVRDEQQLAHNWQKVKQQERQAKGRDEDNSVLAHIPSGLPPLLKAQKLQQRCAKVGFDWPDVQPVFDKINEEVDEVKHELAMQEVSQQKVEEEVGDLLFAVVNLARHLNVDSDSALRNANAKFEDRFRRIEQSLEQQGLRVESADLATMERLWQQAKKP